MKYFYLLLTLIFIFGCERYEMPVLPPSNTPHRPPYAHNDNFNDTTADADSTQLLKILDLQTYVSEDWDRWELTADTLTGYFITYVSEDWDWWEFEYNGHNGYIRTYTSEDWDWWVMHFDTTDFFIRTYVSEDWDYWEIYNTDEYLMASTYVSEDWDRWEIYNDSTYFYLETYVSEDWDRWEIYSVSGQSVKDFQIIATAFIGIFTSSIYINNNLISYRK